MVLQKAMKQGRNVHGINITKDVWPRWGACVLRFCFEVVTGLTGTFSTVSIFIRILW